MPNATTQPSALPLLLPHDDALRHAISRLPLHHELDIALVNERNGGSGSDGWKLRTLTKSDIEDDRPSYDSVQVMQHMHPINHGANDDDIRADLDHQLQWLVKNGQMQLNDIMWIARLTPPSHAPTSPPPLIFRLHSSCRYTAVRKRLVLAQSRVSAICMQSSNDAIASYARFHPYRLSLFAASRGEPRLCRQHFLFGPGCTYGPRCEYSHDVRHFDRMTDGWMEEMSLTRRGAKEES